MVRHYLLYSLPSRRVVVRVGTLTAVLFFPFFSSIILLLLIMLCDEAASILCEDPFSSATPYLRREA